MSQKTVTVVLASAVATSGTFTVTYPAGTNAAWFQKGVTHKIAALGREFSNPEDFGITSFGNTTCTVTWRHALTLPADTTLRVGLDAPGGRWLDDPPVFEATEASSRVSKLYPCRITLGAPITADVDGLVTVGKVTTNPDTVSLSGAQVSDGVATLDVPRNITVTSPNATLAGTTITITGTDEYGNTVIEQIAGQNTATAMAGVKAFNTVTSITVSGTSLTSSHTTSMTVGFGDVLGLPVHLPAAAFVNAELEDGAAASSGTLVAGLAVNTASTATTADVRGTYDPSSACNGTKAFELLVNLSDPTFLGVPQYDG